jgi:hypothetical protein
MRDGSPALLDVVPWNYGFAHSWALAWLAESSSSRDAVLGLLAPGSAGPYHVERVDREVRLAGARADLAVHARDANGTPVRVAVETKVADGIRADQLEAYRQEGHDPVLFLPGLTGLLFSPNLPVAKENSVNGAELADALDGIDLPHIVATYVHSVRAEATRMTDARAVARGELDKFARDGFAPAKDVADAAWIVEVFQALRARDARDMRVRAERNDRGLFWAGAHTVPAGVTEDAGMWIDVIAEIRTTRRAVAIKTGGEVAGRAACYDRATAAGIPGAAWSHGRRAVNFKTFTVCKFDASSLDAVETAKQALAARAFLHSLA